MRGVFDLYPGYKTYEFIKRKKSSSLPKKEERTIMCEHNDCISHLKLERAHTTMGMPVCCFICKWRIGGNEYDGYEKEKED
jgi:hypothetical protein